jgi:hypothetical protein
MTLIQLSYLRARDRIQSLDAIVFSGTEPVSKAIQTASHSPISHIGLAVRVQLLTPAGPDPLDFVCIVESTSLTAGKVGIQLNRCAEHVRQYPGGIYHLPLRADVRARIDWKATLNFLHSMRDKNYDYTGAFLSLASHLPFPIHLGHEDLGRVFCSEFVTACYEAAGIIPPRNASQCWPSEICTWQLYEEDYYQIKGNTRPIPGYNSKPVT